jgi:hypothetical protein
MEELNISGSMLTEGLWIDTTFDPCYISLDYTFKVFIYKLVVSQWQDILYFVLLLKPWNPMSRLC